MDKISCIIIDDEPLGRDLVESFAKEVSYLNILGVFENPVAALFFLEENPVDLIFSDIEMPKINGLDFIRTLEDPPVFIFITAYREFALDGFDTGATDYLVKPVRFDRFLKAVQKAKNQIHVKRYSTSSQEPSDKIFIGRKNCQNSFGRNFIYRSEGRLLECGYRFSNLFDSNDTHFHGRYSAKP